MEIVRFYALDPGPEILAKYTTLKNLGLEELQKLCSPVMGTLTSTDDPYAILNSRIGELDVRLDKAGFGRLPIVDTVDWDKECTKAYDVCFNPKEFSTTYIVWKIEPVVGDPDYEYKKSLESKIVIGAIVH